MLIGNLALQDPWQILPGACELNRRRPFLLGIAPQDFIKVDVFHPVVIARLCLQ